MAVRQQPAAYVESWDACEFPELAFRRERVVLTLDGEVIRGHLRVAEIIIEAALAHNPDLIELEIARWITENRAADDADTDWRRRWEDRLNVTPRLVEALNRSPEILFDRANLTMPQRLAMRLWADGRPGRQAAVQLGISEAGYRERIEKALEAIRAVASAA
jgi:hypothetical protein